MQANHMKPNPEQHNPKNRHKEVIIHTDGACSGNPGPGGWAAVLQYTNDQGQTTTREVSGGEAHTTNNRMELMGAIAALEALKTPCQVRLVTDSRYVQHAFTKGWLQSWQRKGWVTTSKEPVKNRELWERLLELTQTHDVTWDWQKGHAGHAQNERADQLAVAARDAFMRP